ncbi:MAG: hypothetical protein KAQ63_01595, partial [Candidatus Moranbacteria bacterium]|nr:hypothetical protein [Candidatus Moranbacteria bacterium]
MKIKTLKSKIVLSITGLILFFGFLSTIFTFFYTKNIMINNAEKNLLINTLGQSEELSAIFDNSRN